MEVWTENDLKQIHNYAEKLKSPEVKYRSSLYHAGDMTFAEIGAYAHQDDAKTVEAWGNPASDHGKRIKDHIIRRMKAREEAFTLAGLTLNHRLYAVLVYRQVTPDFKHRFVYHSQGDLDAGVAEIKERAERFGECDYVFEHEQPYEVF